MRSDPRGSALIARLLGKAMALSYRLTGKDRYDDFRLERVQGVPFVVMPSVFNPKVPRTGEFLASRLDARLVGRTRKFWIWVPGPASARCLPPSTRAGLWRWISMPKRCAVPASTHA